jgi:hypothetical protein
VVFAIVFQMLEQNFPTVHQGGTPSGDRSARWVAFPDDVTNAPCSVVLGEASYPGMAAEKTLTLGESYRVRFNLAKSLERSAGKPDQTVTDCQHNFGIDAQPAFKEKVEGAVNRSRQAVLNRRENVVSGALVDGRIQRFERRTRDKRQAISQEFRGRLFAEGAVLALKGHSCK